MPGIQDLTDEELLRLAGRGATSLEAPAAKPSGGDIQSLSDEQLLALSKAPGQASVPGQGLVDPDKQAAEAYLAQHPELEGGYAQRFLHGATLGLSEPIVAAGRTAVGELLGTTPKGMTLTERYKRERALTQAQYEKAVEKTGALGTAAELASSLSPVGAVAKGVGKVVAGPLARSVGTGALVGGVESAAEQPDITQAPEAALQGAATGGAGGAIAHGLFGALSKAVGPKVAPTLTTPELKQAAKREFQTFEQAPGVFTRPGLQALENDLMSAVANKYDPDLHPYAKSFFKSLERNVVSAVGPRAGVSPAQVQMLREKASDALRSPKSAEREVAGTIINKLDDFILNAPFTGGSQAQAAEAYEKGRKLWSQYRKASGVEGAVREAELGAASTYSGGNLSNKIRQMLTAYRKRNAKYMTPDEIREFERAIEGTKGQNLARRIGKLSPMGGGMMTMLHLLGTIPSGGFNLPVAGAGIGAKLLEDRAAKASVRKILDLVRSGGVVQPVAPTRAQGLIESVRPYGAGLAGLL